METNINTNNFAYSDEFLDTLFSKAKRIDSFTEFVDELNYKDLFSMAYYSDMTPDYFSGYSNYEITYYFLITFIENVYEKKISLSNENYLSIAFWLLRNLFNGNTLNEDDEKAPFFDEL